VEFRFVRIPTDKSVHEFFNAPSYSIRFCHRLGDWGWKA
jgi:hypothetical protein